MESGIAGFVNGIFAINVASQRILIYPKNRLRNFFKRTLKI